MRVELNDQRFYQASVSLSGSEKKAFIQTIWESSRNFNIFELSSYFKFLETERRRESRVNDPAYSHLSFKHIFNVRNIIYQNYNKSSSCLQKLVEISLFSLNLKPGVLQDVIILVIRLTFMVRVEFANPDAHPSPFQLQMEDNQSFQGTLRELPDRPRLRELSAQNELPLWFNVIDLERKVNLRIDWTDYLNEHLTYQSGTLMLFRHFKVLKYMEKSGDPRFFSSEFLIETGQSLLLLFPSSESKYDGQHYLDWFQKHGPIEEWQRSLTEHDPNSHISRFYEDFPIWHSKLFRLLKISNNQQSWTIKRMWYDDRDQALWWTRWGFVTVIFLVILFGLVKSITGIVLVIDTVQS